MTLHAMIDLETLHTTPRAAVLTVGGVKFDPHNDSEPHSEFYYRLDFDSQDRDISEDTLAWWSRQDPKVQEEAFAEDNRTKVIDFLHSLPKWMVGVDVLWGHGYGFDITIIETLLREKGHNKPWNFWNVRDSRTLFQLMPKDPRKELNFAAHNALEDCRAQARCVQHCYRELGIQKG